jgi:hypothetical protein
VRDPVGTKLLKVSIYRLSSFNHDLKLRVKGIKMIKPLINCLSVENKVSGGQMA